jgi:hypothetical protein
MNERYLGLAQIKNEGEIVSFNGKMIDGIGSRHEADNNTWGFFLANEFRSRGDSYENIMAATLSDADRDAPLNWYKSGSSAHIPWLIWTKLRVYFPVVYDGYLSVGSVPRDPCDERAEAFGG